jgi:hypothetical protein
MEKNFVAANEAANHTDNTYGLNLNSAVAKVAAPYDNEAACAELVKDMKRGDNLSIKFTKDSDNYPSLWVESKNVAGYKVRLNQSILSWVMAYLEDGVAECQYNPEPMAPIEGDSETYKENILKLFINAGKKIQWTPLFRERNGKLSGAYLGKHGKVFFYVKHTDELIDWLRERKQAI